MKTKPRTYEELAAEIEVTAAKLRELEQEIKEIGEPASSTLRGRLNALKIEEHALERNFSENAQPAGAALPESNRMRQVETLLHHIEREETALQHEADFLHQASPTTLELAFRGASRMIDPATRKWKKVRGNRHWLWHSPFVNNTYETLSGKYKMPRRQK